MASSEHYQTGNLLEPNGVRAVGTKRRHVRRVNGITAFAALAVVTSSLYLINGRLHVEQWHYRVYSINSPYPPYPYNRVQQPGPDCSKRTLATSSGEVARSFWIGDTVFEVAQDDGWWIGPAALDGPDCH